MRDWWEGRVSTVRAGESTRQNTSNLFFLLAAVNKTGLVLDDSPSSRTSPTNATASRNVLERVARDGRRASEEAQQDHEEKEEIKGRASILAGSDVEVNNSWMGHPLRCSPSSNSTLLCLQTKQCQNPPRDGSKQQYASTPRR